MDEKIRLIPSELLSIRVNNSWTIKENIGHLTDLEPLWQGRLEDILKGQTELRPTDLQNTRTTEANHNLTPVKKLLAAFRQTRVETLQLLRGLNEEQVFMRALHPRLKTPMRTMDLFLFVAEHDDHHLPKITELMF
ncbi:DinB family protein [Hymenobacter terrenus]|uniref:DinB family protein n=1 Tax=Hymenobacter terrenus TaxID=1629124 RepID=UPI0018CEC096|nr:DinB family protein [Hymenobacter terrenus]